MEEDFNPYLMPCLWNAVQNAVALVNREGGTAEVYGVRGLNKYFVVRANEVPAATIVAAFPQSVEYLCLVTKYFPSPSLSKTYEEIRRRAIACGFKIKPKRKKTDE